METKYCKRCGRDLPADVEHWQPDTRYAGNLYYICRECQREDQRHYRARRARGEAAQPRISANAALTLRLARLEGYRRQIISETCRMLWGGGNPKLRDTLVRRAKRLAPRCRL